METKTLKIEGQNNKPKENVAKNFSQNQIIITTRTRIARNISGFRFNSISSRKEKKDLLNIVKNAFLNSSLNKNYAFYDISKLPKIQRQFLFERHILSPEMIVQLYGKGLILKFKDKNQRSAISILINEEDHIRIQSLMPGLAVYKTYEDVLKVEKLLEKKLNFYFDKDFGYLTSCPTNIGTSLRVSIIAHLPAIVSSGKVEDFIKNLMKIGCNIRGFFGENSDIVGNLFQISNHVSLGKNEEQIMDEMNAICLNIIDSENEAIEHLKKNKPVSVEDSILRAYGMLKYAKMFCYGEALELISMIKLGQTLGILKNLKNFDFYQLISLLGESNIIIDLKNKINGIKFNNKDIIADNIDRIRADIIRKKILNDFNKGF